MADVKTKPLTETHVTLIAGALDAYEASLKRLLATANLNEVKQAYNRQLREIENLRTHLELQI